MVKNHIARLRSKPFIQPILDRYSLLVVGVLTVLFVVLATLVLDPSSNIAGISTTVFQVAGTMVALVLPAAGLIGEAITRIANYWIDIVVDPKRGQDQEEDARTGDRDIEAVKTKALYAWRGSVYVLVALLFSSIAMFIDPQIFACGTPLIHWFLGFALGFLLVGSYWFFPIAWWFYTLEALENTQNILKAYQVNSPQTSETEDNPDERGP